jgi:flagellar protein FlaG
MEDIPMIIQKTPIANQPVQPVVRAGGPAPDGAERKTVATTPNQSSPPQASAAKLETAVAAINQAMLQSNRSLEFSLDTDTRKTVVKMVDTNTGELIRQFPSEEVLAISRSIDQFQQGLLLTQKA